MKVNQQILQFRDANCRNCYKCVRNCPVRAVAVSDHRARIREEECILCENCTLVCPQNAKVEVNQMPHILKELQQGKQMVISIHPGYLAEYGSGSLKPLIRELKRLGFTHVHEMAEVVPYVKQAYEEWMTTAKREVQLSSHCPVIVQLIQKHFPTLEDKLVPLASIMGASGRVLREKYPEAKIVALMPCIGSLTELNEPENCVDYIVTFSVLQRAFLQQGIHIRPEEKVPPMRSRTVVKPGGFSGLLSMPKGRIKVPVDGLEKVIRVLHEVEDGGYEDCFLDLYACREGCLGGPSFRNRKTRVLDLLLDTGRCAAVMDDFPIKIEGVSQARTFPHQESVEPEEFTEEEIREVMAKMDKFDAEDELNCGACGYETCRDKAIAYLQGKAELGMCVPYMRDRQDTYAEKIINAVPGLLVTVDYQLHIVTANRNAQEFFCMKKKRKLMGEPISHFMNDEAIIDMISDRKPIAQDQVLIPDLNRTLDRVFTNDRRNRLILCMMKDITREKIEQEKLVQAQIAAAHMADRLVEEQLRIVHEIAGLLGETAADTTVAVEKLKATIRMEEEEGKV